MSSALPSTNSNPMPDSSAMARSTVDFPVPGGPSISRCRPAASAATTDLQFAGPPHDPGREAVDEGRPVLGRGPGGTGHNASTPRMFLPSRMSWYPSFTFSSG